MYLERTRAGAYETKVNIHVCELVKVPHGFDEVPVRAIDWIPEQKDIKRSLIKIMRRSAVILCMNMQRK